jgi:hypothetical protein
VSEPGPCRACPWRVSNQGTRHPDGWYTARNLARLWGGLRNGEDMSCHPTDPDNPVSERAAAAGYRPAPGDARKRECVGAAILKQREFMLLQEVHDADLRAYRAARPRGLTRGGLLVLLERALFGGTPLSGPVMPLPNLDEPDVHYAPLGQWEPPPANPQKARP